MDNANSAQRDSEIVGLVNLPVRLLYMGKLFNDATLLGKLEAAPQHASFEDIQKCRCLPHAHLLHILVL